MKFCPTCQTRYDEEILRFCTKDGTPLVEERQPNFTEMPSESFADEHDEETIVRRKSPTNPLPDFEEKPPSAPRIIIPTTEDRREQEIRSRTTAHVPPPPQKSNTAKVVFLTILGTIVVLAGVGGIFWMLQSERAENTNSNANILIENVNTEPPTNLNIGNTFDFNINANTNSNTNANIGVKTPTPTPTPKPTPTPTATPSPTPDNEANTSTNTNSGLPANTRPTATPTPRPDNSDDPPTNRPPVNAGVLNGRALNLPTPAYPSSARALRASGRVTVQVLVDEDGNVTSAKATSGHPLLRQAAEAAARQSRFNPIKVNNQAVSATGVLIYNFVN